jgi:hypothetical protein
LDRLESVAAGIDMAEFEATSVGWWFSSR